MQSTYLTNEKFKTIPEEKKAKIHPMLNKIERFAKQQKFKPAIKLLNSAIQKEGPYHYLLALKANCYLENGEKDKCMELVEEIENSVVDPKAIAFLELIFSNLYQKKRSIRMYQAALKTNPSNVNYLEGLLGCFLRNCDYYKAHGIFNRIGRVLGEKQYYIRAGTITVAIAKEKLKCEKEGAINNLLKISQAFFEMHFFKQKIELFFQSAFFEQVLKIYLEIVYYSKSKSDFLNSILGKVLENTESPLFFDNLKLIISILTNNKNYELAKKVILYAISIQPHQFFWKKLLLKVNMKTLCYPENPQIIFECDKNNPSLKIQNLPENFLNLDKNVEISRLKSVFDDSTPKIENYSRDDFLSLMFYRKKLLLKLTDEGKDINLERRKLAKLIIDYFEIHGEKICFYFDAEIFLKCCDDEKHFILKEIKKIKNQKKISDQKKSIIMLLNYEKIRQFFSDKEYDLLSRIKKIFNLFETAFLILPNNNDLNGAENFLFVLYFEIVSYYSKTNDQNILMNFSFILDSVLKKYENQQLRFIKWKIDTHYHFFNPDVKVTKFLKNIQLETTGGVLLPKMVELGQSVSIPYLEKALEFYKKSTTDILENINKFFEKNDYKNAAELLIFAYRIKNSLVLKNIELESVKNHLIELLEKKNRDKNTKEILEKFLRAENEENGVEKLDNFIDFDQIFLKTDKWLLEIFECCSDTFCEIQQKKLMLNLSFIRCVYSISNNFKNYDVYFDKLRGNIEMLTNKNFSLHFSIFELINLILENSAKKDTNSIRLAVQEFSEKVEVYKNYVKQKNTSEKNFSLSPYFSFFSYFCYFGYAISAAAELLNKNDLKKCQSEIINKIIRLVEDFEATFVSFGQKQFIVTENSADKFIAGFGYFNDSDFWNREKNEFVKNLLQRQSKFFTEYSLHTTQPILDILRGLKK